MAKKVCAQPGCPVLLDASTRGGRCPDHARRWVEIMREELARCAQRLEEARRAWQAVRTRRRAFEVLEARADAEALAQAQRLAQKMLDEHASQKHLRRAREEGADER